ncbi:hypothetical protein K458DRAFT_378264 [Lentithecium fluviatile CBS 122367]|uniref:Prion-inhibition and propagation HeLo domain-containing protein n=1 Tax=Lentithecium fluviatile CBS 122367 TaxID=1168545 RepID=A0A6G1IH32_9PLEO|nr:hypothetical protein K458DRAFT_378264 [Lentithecium fluviatile CBS 122367]
MEVAGLAVGVAGLAGLYGCCSSAFQLVQKGRSFGKDYKILETKFGNQELRLRAWGRACGLVDGTQYDQRLDEPELFQQLKATLECIKLLLSDAQELKERYGLRSCSRSTSEEMGASLAPSSSSSGGSSTSPGRRASLGRLLLRRSLIQRNDSTSALRTGSSSTIATAHWIIEDREKFSELARHLKDFIDDLEDLTKATEIPRRQLVFVEYEIECINDIETLEDMESAREDDHDVVSDAASSRLERMSQGTASIRSPRDSGRASFMTVESAITLESLESYFTARTQFSRPSSIIDSEYFIPGAEFYRVVGYKAYGDQALSNKLLRLQARPRDPQEILRKGQFGGKRKGNPRFKCVVVGDSSARKTELLSCFALGGFPTAHTPLVFKEYATECNVDGNLVDLTLWDTSGQEDYDQLRRNAYGGSSVVIICFLIESSPDYDQIRQKWIPEVRERCPATGRIIVGIEPDGAYKTSRIDITRGKRLAQEVDAMHYIQCNLESGAGVDDVFEAATRAAIRAKLPSLSRGWRLPWRAIDQTGGVQAANPTFGPKRDQPAASHPAARFAADARRPYAAPASSLRYYTYAQLPPSDIDDPRQLFVANPDDSMVGNED